MPAPRPSRCATATSSRSRSRGSACSATPSSPSRAELDGHGSWPSPEPAAASACESLAKRRAQLGASEREIAQPSRDGALTVEQQVGHLPEAEAQDERRDREQRRPPEHGSELARGLALAKLLGRDRVHGAGERLVVDREPVDANEIVELDPGEELAPAPERPA